jgi:hypothetical protein
MTALQRFQSWYLAQCDGDWEHGAGITISTLDNPGWSIEVDLTGTAAEAKPFTKVWRESSEHDWLHATSNGSTFKIACGPQNLEEALSLFCDWAADENRE